jgi:hypothetical protein
MKEIIRYMFIYLTTFNAERAAKVYQMIYYPNVYYKNNEKKDEITKPIERQGEIKPKNKNDELRETLKYLKSKKTKTPRDKSTISFLEGMGI